MLNLATRMFGMSDSTRQGSEENGSSGKASGSKVSHARRVLGNGMHIIFNGMPGRVALGRPGIIFHGAPRHISAMCVVVMPLGAIDLTVLCRVVIDLVVILGVGLLTSLNSSDNGPRTCNSLEISWAMTSVGLLGSL